MRLHIASPARPHVHSTKASDQSQVWMHTTDQDGSLRSVVNSFAQRKTGTPAPDTASLANLWCVHVITVLGCAASCRVSSFHAARLRTVAFMSAVQLPASRNGPWRQIPATVHDQSQAGWAMDLATLLQLAAVTAHARLSSA